MLNSYLVITTKTKAKTSFSQEGLSKLKLTAFFNLQLETSWVEQYHSAIELGWCLTYLDCRSCTYKLLMNSYYLVFRMDATGDLDLSFHGSELFITNLLAHSHPCGLVHFPQWLRKLLLRLAQWEARNGAFSSSKLRNLASWKAIWLSGLAY